MVTLEVGPGEVMGVGKVTRLEPQDGALLALEKEGQRTLNASCFSL